MATTATEPARAGPLDDLEALEVELLLEGINRRYGFAFRGYAAGSIRRRLWRPAHGGGVATI